jgi:hypothetical protein
MSLAADRARAERFLRSFGSRILALYRRFSEGLPDRRCRSCAFREMERCGVDGWKGWDSSLMGLVRSAGVELPGKGPQVFVCHRAAKRAGAWVPHRRPRFCAGYAVLAGRSELKRALCEAAIDCDAGAS